MRLFVALEPPESVRADLAAAVAPLRARHAELRWVAPERWHLTLAFLGEVPDGRLAGLRTRLGRVAARHAPLTLRFERAGRFGDRVLWTAVAGDAVPVRRLAESAAAAARHSGIEIEDRAYRPHLTLARGRPGCDLRPLAAELATYSGPEWNAATLHLVRSTLGSRAHYDDVLSWPLAAVPGSGAGSDQRRRG